MKRILILTAGFGEGEDVAAWNVREAIDRLAPNQMRIEVLDLLDSCYGRFHDLLRHTFQAAINHAPRLWHGFYQLLGHSQFVEGQIDGLTRLRDSLRDVLLTMEPEVVISTCPIYGFLMDEIYRDGRARDFVLISLVTDAVVSDSPWPRVSGDHFAVANEMAARALIAAGVPEKKVQVFGFPVRMSLDDSDDADFALAQATAKGRGRILYVINSARKKAPKLIDRLLEHPEWDITVCVGRDTELEEMARAKAATAPERMEVLGNMKHVQRMPRLLREHHVVISKAEAGIVQEAIAGRCPMIVFRTGSGQEEANFSILRNANAGVLAEKPKEVVDWISRVFKDDARLLSLWRKNLEPLGRPDSALNLARFVLEQAIASSMSAPKIRALPAPDAAEVTASKLSKTAKIQRLPKKLLLCDLHTHTTWSDGKLTVPEMVDFYGQRGFDCLCITDHLCDPKRLLKKW